MLILDFALLCFCSSVLTPLHSLYKLSLFNPFFFRFLSLSLCCKGCASLGCPFTAILMSKFLYLIALVQYPISLVSSGLDGSSIPLLMFSIGIYILPLITKLLSACCDIFVIYLYIVLCLLQYCFIYVHAVILVVLKMFVYSCLSK